MRVRRELSSAGLSAFAALASLVALVVTLKCTRLSLTSMDTACSSLSRRAQHHMPLHGIKTLPPLTWPYRGTMMTDGTMWYMSLLMSTLAETPEDVGRYLCLSVVCLSFLIIWLHHHASFFEKVRTDRSVPCPCRRGRRERSPPSSWSGPGSTARGASCRSNPGRSTSCSPWSATPPAGCPP